jgi:hypothetical protein
MMLTDMDCGAMSVYESSNTATHPARAGQASACSVIIPNLHQTRAPQTAAEAAVRK